MISSFFSTSAPQYMNHVLKPGHCVLISTLIGFNYSSLYYLKKEFPKDSRSAVTLQSVPSDLCASIQSLSSLWVFVADDMYAMNTIAFSVFCPCICASSFMLNEKRVAEI